MNSKILLGFYFAIFVVVSEVSGRCTGCGFGDGLDYCAPCNPNPTLVRPIPVSPTKVKCIKPVGDVCSCKDIEVKPVVVSRPKCVYKPKKVSVTCDNRPLVPAPDYLHDFSQDVDVFDTAYLGEKTACGTRPLYPVDAVSISLVNRMQDSLAASLPEEKLQYGFYSIPKDVQTYKNIPNVPEEKLFTVERQIIELKNPKQIVKCNTGCDEDIVLENKEQPIAYLSYSDLGYVPEEAAAPKFITSCIRKGGKHPKYYYDSSEEYGSSSSSEESSEEYRYKPKPCGCKKVRPCGCGCH